MLKRPEEFGYSAERFNDRIKLADGESKEARFKTWLADKKAKPRFCKTHPRELLIPDPTSAKIWPACKDRTNDVCYNPWHEPEIIPGVFDFVIELRCPACRCAYALCPPESHTTSFDTFDTSTPERAATLAKAREFVSQVNTHGCGFALFVGPTGPGKTRLACNVVRELNHRDALYVRQGELTCALRATYGRKDVVLHRSRRDDDGEADDESPTPLEIVQKVRFLVLDEIGCTALANDERLLLDELFKYRYEHRKPTILISNLPLTGPPEAPGLKQFLGDALTDRIKEATGNGKFIVQFSGESYRRTTGEDYLTGLP